MGVPLYTEDLTDIDTGLAETTTGYVAYGGGASGLGAGPDFAMQGTNCVDKQITNAEKGILYNKGAGVTIPAGDHVFTWQFTATPGVCNSLANRGVVINIGSGSGAFCKYHVDGGDTFGAVGRVGKCYPIDPSVYTANTGSVPYRTLVGAPSGVFQYFGAGLSTNATVKSANMGLDAQRYGTGAYLTAGELISAGDASDDPCTFTGYGTENDLVANRWGILNALLELQGMFAIGQNNAGVATLARFEESDVTIKFVDTPHAAADFTQIVIDHASTVCNLTNVSLIAEGTINKGRFIVNANNPTVSIIGGTYTDIGIVTLQSNTTVDGLVLRRTEAITPNGASLDNVTVEGCTAAIAVTETSLSNITDSTFISGGTGHAIEITTAGTYTFTGNQFTDYALVDGTTGNEAVYNNSGGLVTINIDGGGGTPTIRNGAGATTVVVNASSFTFTVNPSHVGYEWRVYEVTAIGSLTGAVEVDGEEVSTADNQTYSYEYSVDQPIAVQIISLVADFEEAIEYYTLTAASKSVTINLSKDNNN